MFDNVAFNVVIGLVFIYLLYSLLITTIGELVSTKLGIRARLLRIAIERMFNDGYLQKIEGKKHKWLQGWLRKNFLYEADEFKKSFAGLFYDYPAIKYLGRIEDNHKGRFSSTKPSYFSPDYFADTLINFLSDKGTGASSMDKIAFCLKFNTYHIQPKTLKQFRNLLESAGGNKEVYKQNIIKWFNETMDRANGWHKRKMRTISFWLALIIAASFNVDSIRIAKILANDKEARNQLVNMGVALSKDSARYKNFVNRNGDTVHSSVIVDTGFARITKDINAANVILGLGWGFSDSLTSDNMCFNSKDSSDSLFQKSINSLDDLLLKKKTTINNLTDSLKKLAINKQKLDSLYNDTIITKNQVRLFANDSIRVRDSVQAVSDTRFTNDTNLIKHIKAEINIILAQMRNDSAALIASNVLSKIVYANINGMSGKKYVLIDSIRLSGEKNTRIIYGKRQYSFSEKLAFIFSHILWYNLIGFVITAFALSLGAPFWFDLLNKIVSIRGVGVKPEEKKKKIEEKGQETLLQIEDQNVKQKDSTQITIFKDNIEEAISIVADQLYKIPGIKAIIQGNNGTNDCVQFNVADSSTAEIVKNKFPFIKLPDNIQIPVMVVVTGTPKAYSVDGQITNETGVLGFGTMGCIVDDPDAGQSHILSCWHVMKGDEELEKDDVFKKIFDNNNNHIADRWGGGIYDCFDYGFALCKDGIRLTNEFIKSELKIPNASIKTKPIADSEIKKRINVKFYDYLQAKIRSGKIYSGGFPVEIDYDTGTNFFINDVIVLTDDSDGRHKTLSDHGNSGTIVFDDSNNAIAMIIAGDANYSYAIRLSKVFALYPKFKII